MTENSDTRPIDQLLDIMRRLRDPNHGCPWDLEQTFRTIAPYTVEEAYEVVDAITRDDHVALQEELGDLLLQVVFHAQMATETGIFSFDDVTATICEKMVRRHPHVFGTAKIDTAEAQTESWESQKAAERRAKASSDGRYPSALDGIAVALPALTRSRKLQERAARVGFDWAEAEPILSKIAEEIEEVRVEMSATPVDPENLAGEIGDVLFAVTNLARHLGIDPEAALDRTNRKFERRFRRIEDILRAREQQPTDVDLSALEELWQRAKSEEA